MAVRSVKNGQTLSRFAYSVSKRVGNAVVRNRVRRRLREIVRLLPFLEGYDVVITARPPAATSSFQELGVELTRLMKRADLMHGA